MVARRIDHHYYQNSSTNSFLVELLQFPSVNIYNIHNNSSQNSYLNATYKLSPLPHNPTRPDHHRRDLTTSFPFLDFSFSIFTDTHLISGKVDGKEGV